MYQNEVKCSTFQMEMILHSHANKTHFHKKGCESEAFWDSEVAYYHYITGINLVRRFSLLSEGWTEGTGRLLRCPVDSLVE